MGFPENPAANSALTNEEERSIYRPVVEFPECIWKDRIKPLIVDKQEYEKQAKEIEMLKEEVRIMLIKVKEAKTSEKLELIDTIERLGISYHFEKEIDELLEQIYLQNGNNSNAEEDLQNDLYATALLFRLLRQHGFNISSDIFRQFLDGMGEFKESLINDKRGLLSLYQAAYVRTHEGNILDKAVVFATTHLEHGSQQEMSPCLAKQVKYALDQPLHRDVPRLQARHYISVYEEDEGKNPLLLRFAKLDYRYLQILHRKELDELISWRDDLKNCVPKVPYSRDRVVECYFWAMSTFFEPQYALCRLTSAKTSVFITLVDDTYDAYGELDELEAFRNAIESYVAINRFILRWDVKEADRLPKYMRPIYIGLIKLGDWVDEELKKRGNSRRYASAKYIEEWKQYVRTSYTQSCWFLNRELPTFQEYTEVGLITSTNYLLTPASLLFMESYTEDVFNWLEKNPEIVVAGAKFGRFINDIASHETERERGATGLECYARHYNVSEEEAIKKLEEIVEDGWKDTNEELLRPTAVPRENLMPVLNLSRMVDVTYKHYLDGYTNPILVLEPHIVKVLLDLIVV
ncbi:OLC1v1015867C1 [Oldenlandia corymbosa var. corymbosa]|uniref:myrcene synthase n=1 Tax=Oldenlandia corymbosa var. corymbosa TaxID=529605 RepID=A0AAV1E722_OLDCO|nr:OLC1v1015867C1 [Oldenlandia corymbosa var. corymbosa]